MGALDGSIVFETAERRACYAAGKKALFHRWAERAEIVPPSPMIGGHSGGVMKWTVAIVEYEDGTVDCVMPSHVHFLPAPEFEEIAWEMMEGKAHLL